MFCVFQNICGNQLHSYKWNHEIQNLTKNEHLFRKKKEEGKQDKWLVRSANSVIRLLYSNSYSISVTSVLETPILTLCMTDDDVLTVRCDVLTTFVDTDSVEWCDLATSIDWNFDELADCSTLFAELLCICRLLWSVPWANFSKLD